MRQKREGEPLRLKNKLKITDTGTPPCRKIFQTSEIGPKLPKNGPFSDPFCHPISTKKHQK